MLLLEILNVELVVLLWEICWEPPTTRFAYFAKLAVMVDWYVVVLVVTSDVPVW